MRIEGEPGQSLPAAYLWLTKEEASELRDALVDLLAEGGPDWHAHVSSGDFSTEITIACEE
ncbi:hypothetical protein [Pengzhenrongella phosphoraccumulans]|uniref:hypothetical protein n=1 Tax=Pengzhenrongella phosphoraccumulans TaxID=3114394 RepID=UPI00388E097F